MIWCGLPLRYKGVDAYESEYDKNDTMTTEGDT